MKKKIIGARESIGFPDLGLDAVIARVDTGAKTSSLHVERLQIETVDSKNWVLFSVESADGLLSHRLPVVSMRKVVSSNGMAEKRPTIKTRIQLGGKLWSIRLTLTNREQMSHPMLLGRQAMGRKFLVDPAQDFLLSLES